MINAFTRPIAKLEGLEASSALNGGEASRATERTGGVGDLGSSLTKVTERPSGPIAFRV